MAAPTAGISAEAAAFLSASGAKLLQMKAVSLVFPEEVEAQYLADMAERRWPVLVFVLMFDVGCYILRFGTRLLAAKKRPASPMMLIGSLAPQLVNMAMCYFFLSWVNRRSRRIGGSAAIQEEYMLSAVMALAITSLLATLTLANAQDYVLACFFLISTTSFLKIRWFIGTLMQGLPVGLVMWWHGINSEDSFLPIDSLVHISIAWAVGALMSFLSDTYRRQMFANHRLAFAAAEMEVQEAKARLDAQNQLAAAQAQAAQRALVVAREKASNEAKSEFMSLMCHEVRTPLNGCLASAEMLLETELQEEQRDLAKTIRVSGSILLSTVSNFLDFFKMEAGKALDIVHSDVDVQELVSDVHCIIDAMVGKDSGVGLMRPSSQGVPDVVVGDPDRLRGILLNLYTNAAKFTRRGTIAMRVSVAGPDYRPWPEAALYGRGQHVDLTRSFGEGDSLTVANLESSDAHNADVAARAAAAVVSARTRQQQRSRSGEATNQRGINIAPSKGSCVSAASLGGSSTAASAAFQSFLHAPARNSGGGCSGGGCSGGGVPDVCAPNTASTAARALLAKEALFSNSTATNANRDSSSLRERGDANKDAVSDKAPPAILGGPPLVSALAGAVDFGSEWRQPGMGRQQVSKSGQSGVAKQQVINSISGSSYITSNSATGGGSGSRDSRHLLPSSAAGAALCAVPSAAHTAAATAEGSAVPSAGLEAEAAAPEPCTKESTMAAYESACKRAGSIPADVPSDHHASSTNRGPDPHSVAVHQTEARRASQSSSRNSTEAVLKLSQLSQLSQAAEHLSNAAVFGGGDESNVDVSGTASKDSSSPSRQQPGGCYEARETKERGQQAVSRSLSGGADGKLAAYVAPSFGDNSGSKHYGPCMVLGESNAAEEAAQMIVGRTAVPGAPSLAPATAAIAAASSCDQGRSAGSTPAGQQLQQHARGEQQQQQQVELSASSTSSISRLVMSSWQAASDGAEFMTAALARRCAGLSQLSHDRLSWSGARGARDDDRKSSGGASGGSGNGIDNSADERFWGRDSGANTGTATRESSSCASMHSACRDLERHSFDTFDAGGDTRRSLQATLLPRRSLEALRRSVELRQSRRGRRPRLSWDWPQGASSSVTAQLAFKNAESANAAAAAAGLPRSPHPSNAQPPRTALAGGPNSRRGSREAQTARVSFDSSVFLPPHHESRALHGSCLGSHDRGEVPAPHDLWQQAKRHGTLSAGGRLRSTGNSSSDGGGRSRGYGSSSGAPLPGLATDSVSTDLRPGSDRRSSGSGGRLKGPRHNEEHTSRVVQAGGDRGSVDSSFSDTPSSNHMDTVSHGELPPGWSSVASRSPPLHADQPPPAHWLVFEVMDTGVGIPERGLRSLFKEYVQGSDEEMRRPRSRGGTGLGLSICCKQVAVLGGQIGALSKQGEGSTFWFTVPLRLPESPPVDASSHAGSRVSRESSAALSGHGEKLRSQSLPAVSSPRSSQARELHGAEHIVPQLAEQQAGQHPQSSTGAAASRSNGNDAQAARVASTAVAKDKTHEDGLSASGSSCAQQRPGDGQWSWTSLGGSQLAKLQRNSGSSASSPRVTTGSRRRTSLEARRRRQHCSSLEGRRVLLAEDNLINQTVAKKMLSQMGLSCTVAANGAEAVAAVAAPGASFDVVLMDMAMPVMGGVSATKNIRGRGLTVPIVAMTANASDKDRDECLDAGMDGFLSKPVLKDRLAEALLLVLGTIGKPSPSTHSNGGGGSSCGGVSTAQQLIPKSRADLAMSP